MIKKYKTFFSRNDPKDIRFGDWTQSVDLDDDLQTDLVILGYPDDEGIQLNKGRAGAAQAPEKIRNYFYKLTPSEDFPAFFQIGDLGDLNSSGSLSEKHLKAQNLIQQLTEKDLFWISLGGGHDYGFSDGSGFLKGLIKTNLNPLIINFDAHMDVRPTDQGFHSGTPFRRLLEDFPQKFDLLEVGIQAHCNSRDHIKWAKEKGVEVLTIENVRGSLKEIFTKKSLQLSLRPTFLSLDMDVFQNSEAPGCSQSWPGGLSSTEFFQCLPILFQNLDVRGLGIYEASPPLDVDDRTSKLASLCMYQSFLQHLQFKKSGA